MFGNLISERFSRLLNLKIVGSQRTTGTAAKGGSITILGKTASPVRLYLENVNRVVTFTPYVVRDLAHPVNLGQQFLRESEACMSFSAKGVQLKIGSSTTHLTTSRISLGRATIDSRLKTVIDVLKQQGDNPLPADDDAILDLRVNQVNEPKVDEVNEDTHNIPGLYQAQTKSMLSWHPTRTRIHNTKNITVPSQSSVVVDVTTGKPGQKRLLPVKHGPVLLFPKQTNALLNSKMLFVHPGAYQRDSETFRVVITNLSYEDVKLPSGCNLGSISESQTDHTPKVNALDHRPVEMLTETELVERREYIIKALKLDENDILTKGEKGIKDEIVDIFMQNFDAVSVSDSDFGDTKLMKYTIDLIPGTKPIRSKLRPLNPLQEKDLQRQIDAWLEAEVIEPSTSPWASALVPVKKKGSDKLRWAVDYRRLNDVTIKDAYPLANIECNLHKLATAEVFSTLDSAGAFHTMPIREEDRDLTAFVTPFGHYRFSKLPFGLANAPAAYSRLVQIALDRLPRGFSLGFIDDIIIYSSTIREHIDHLRQVVRLHASVGMKLNLNKCHIMRKEVEYLGHLVSSDGIQMIPSYVDRIMDWPLPEKGKDLASFLGFTGYYRSFIKEYSFLTAEMNKLKKDDKIIWTDKVKSKFQRLKEVFKEKPVRGYPRYDLEEPFILDSDWSSVNMACVLSQKQDGKEIFLGCTAKKCNPAEQNYASHKGELAAVILGLRKFEHLLRAKPFIIRTDSRCVQFLQGIKEARGIWARWNTYLCSFNFKTVHRAGSKQINADCLSRRPGVPMDDQDNDPSEPLHDADDIYHLDEPAPKVQGITLSDLRKAVEGDRVLSTMCTFVRSGHKPTQEERKTLTEIGLAYVTRFECLEFDDGILYFQGVAVNGIVPPRRYCLPVKYYDLAFQITHCNELSGHYGILQTYRRMKQFCYFPYQYQYCSARINSCPNCIRKIAHLPKAKHQRYSQLLSFFGQLVFCDLVGPLTACMYEGKLMKYFMTMQCGFTRYLIAVPLPDARAATVVDAIISKWILHHGVFHHLHTDRGSCYTSFLMKEVLLQLGVKQTFTPAYTPESDRVERVHQTLGNVLRSNDRVDSRNWPIKLTYAVMAYNSTIHRITGVSPYEAVYGRAPTLPVDLVFPVKGPQATTFSTHIANLRMKFAQICEKMIENEGTALARRNLTHQGHNLPVYKEGDTVLYFLSRVRRGLSRKLQTRWLGPFRIKKVVSESLVILYPIGRWAVNPREIHTVVNRIRKVDAPVSMSLLQPSRRHQIDLESLGDELDESAEILTYQDDFLDNQDSARTLPSPPPLITPRIAEAPVMEREAITADSVPRGVINSPRHMAGAGPSLDEGRQSPPKSPVREEKFQIHREINPSPGARDPIPPIRGEISPSPGSATGQNPAPDREMPSPTGRPVRAAAEAAKATITQMIVDPFHRRKKT